jgi:hypothetical protein
MMAIGWMINAMGMENLLINSEILIKDSGIRLVIIDLT